MLYNMLEDKHGNASLLRRDVGGKKGEDKDAPLWFLDWLAG